MADDDEKEPTTDPAVRELKARGPMVVRIALGIAACVPAFVGYMKATSEVEDAKVEAQVVKAKAEKASAVVEEKVVAGYSVTRADVEELKARVARLERAMRSAKLAVRAAPPPAPVPLPPTLEKAVEQVKAAEPAKP